MKVVKIEVPSYDPNKGIEYKWESGFEIEAKIQDGVIKITANKEGLVSLGNHLLNLAQDDIPSGYHLHFDEYNSLDEGSSELVVQKK
ncbi:hypothetical protein GA0116948_107194 [Chitinophaga costaii]|uniref:Uncharacterized protein n=1 Tax=Chitinophaga costaii TaxID=1335309 RepID=A0A1C4E9P1_9BACT|nr:hypothetical protein [Chitinophaga costaii]PUZ24225.1 hypothetical protein DCM91_12370 [Chitinophaga costaii]SCC40357.1 hypothetical protein GA0116948_107194 [Chitinophaga costaii]